MKDNKSKLATDYVSFEELQEIKQEELKNTKEMF